MIWGDMVPKSMTTKLLAPPEPYNWRDQRTWLQILQQTIWRCRDSHLGTCNRTKNKLQFGFLLVAWLPYLLRYAWGGEFSNELSSDRPPHWIALSGINEQKAILQLRDSRSRGIRNGMLELSTILQLAIWHQLPWNRQINTFNVLRLMCCKCTVRS